MIAITTALSHNTEPGVYQIAEDDWICVPETLGPTWTRYPNWFELPEFERIRLQNLNKVDPEGYVLPDRTLGWQAIDWAESNLLADETDEYGEALPFSFTSEQLRFILWFYAIDATGRFLYREVVLQRLKGWG